MYRLKFINPNYDGDVWVKVISIDYTPEDYYNYTIAINDVLDDSENYTANEYNWSVVEGYNPFITSFSSVLMQDLQSKISNKISFGLTYSYDKREWEIVDGDILSDDNTRYRYNLLKSKLEELLNRKKV